VERLAIDRPTIMRMGVSIAASSGASPMILVSILLYVEIKLQILEFKHWSWLYGRQGGPTFSFVRRNMRYHRLVVVVDTSGLLLIRALHVESRLFVDPLCVRHFHDHFASVSCQRVYKSLGAS